MSGGPGGSGGGVVPKSQKSKRKISLPWFRQGSVAKNHPALSRQHTIDTPSSFQARLRRQPSNTQLVGVLEMTWVISDYSAQSPDELTVSKGQQVEVIEHCSNKTDYCLVRMPTRGTGDHGEAPVPEGLVPLAVLKQPPPVQTASRGSPSHSRRIVQSATEIEIKESTLNDTTALNTSSPVNKRRGFSGRKWLPPPLRKLSQGKLEKSQNSTLEKPPLKKTGSDKRIKIPVDMGNKPSVSEGEDEDEQHPVTLKGTKSLPGNGFANGAPDDPDEELELPPPMKPIQEPILITSPPPSTMPDIDDNPGKREQHTEHQEKNLSLQDTKSDIAFNTDVDATKELGITHSNNEPTAGFSGDEGDKQDDDSAKKIEGFLKKRAFVLQELIDTEEAYVKDLSLIVNGYMKIMRDPECDVQMPEDLAEGKYKVVFGNIETIYEWHRDIFLTALRKAGSDIFELAQLFKRYQRKLHMYVVYCHNKPLSEYIVSEYLDTYFEDIRIKLGHKWQLCDLLIKPVQRIMKYQLMLKDIIKYTERAGLINEVEQLQIAYDIMVFVPKEANDMMDVGRLQGFKGKITAQGKLLLHGTVSCSDIPGTNNPIMRKNKDLQVFLFDQSIIFSESVGKKTQFVSPQYHYKAHIQVNKMNLEIRDESFILTSTDEKTPTVGFLCQVPPDVYPQWVTTLKNILETQKNFSDALQSPIAYVKELTRDFDPTYRRTSSVVSTSSATTLKIAKTAMIKSSTTSNLDQSEVSEKTPVKEKGSKFFDGFKNSFKSKHKSDPIGVTVALSNDKKGGIHRRHSETNRSPVL